MEREVDHLNTDIVNIVLTKEEYRNLLNLKKGRNLPDECIRQLRQFGFVDINVTKWEAGRAKEFHYTISQNGLRFIQHMKNVRSDQRWTRWLAVIAIIVSVASLAVSVLSAASQFSS